MTFGSGVAVHEEKTVSVAHAPTIVLESDAGNVELTGGGAGSVHVDAEKFAPTQREAEAIPFSVEDQDNVVKIVFRKPNGDQRNLHIDFKIQAPKDSVLHVSTGGGNVDISSFSQGVTGHTGGGNVHVTNVAGDVRIDTGGGNIEGGGLDGAIDLNTGGGNIDATGELRGKVKLSTGGGNIDARAVDGELKAQTGGGNISVGGRFSGNNQISTGAGNIETILPADSALSIHATTGLGHISDDFGLQANNARMGVSAMLSGQLGNGSSSLNINTGAGNVSIEKG